MVKMNDIVKTSWLAENIREIWIRNPLIAEKFKPGQFLIVHQDEQGERIPLTIIEAENDLIRLVVQIVGYSTARLCSLKPGDAIIDITGPLGKPAYIKKYGNVVAIAGGIGAAPLRPVAVGLRDAGNVLTIIKGVTRHKYLLEELRKEFKEIASEFILTSNDGSIGRKGLVTEPLVEMIENGKIPDFVYAVGPPVMLKSVSDITKQYSIPLTVSLNTIMVDGMGMCGACRVEVGGCTKLSCVDGPEFDGNNVDFDLLVNRLKIYENEEKVIKAGYEQYLEK